ncbi:hypothetical protein [Actinoplanes aureus]|uniref:Tetratricopeptide repeat protein n=1 Tax=Actinoplanes aureus TaxID=2792083 RepID=A0A931C607_9ACTN|nr:hypothetical protein [Actinoplanes aureus]MBG0561277.1 hypothetical protein [Actinoplanes aureus]
MTAAARARVLADVGRLREAEEAVRAGLIDVPADPELLALLAGLLRLQGRRADALAAAGAAVAAAPHLSGTHIERAECLLLLPDGGRKGRSRADEERLAEALGEAEEAVRLDPAHPPAHRVLARVLTLRRDFGGAREAARRALELAPESVPDLLTLAEIERQAGHRDPARQAVRDALARDPDNPDGRWMIALLDAERLRVGRAMRGLRDLAADHPARLDAATMTWPIRGLLSGLHRGLAAGVAVTGLLVVAASWWPGAVLLARASAVTVAVVLLLFMARVLIPAGLVPWRCLALLPARTRRAVPGGLIAAGATVALLLAYAVTARWQAMALAFAARMVLLVIRRADPV